MNNFEVSRYILDFNDYNYDNIIFDITNLSLGGLAQLDEQLYYDKINHRDRIYKTDYFCIQNCDVIDEETIYDFDVNYNNAKIVELKYENEIIFGKILLTKGVDYNDCK